MSEELDLGTLAPPAITSPGWYRDPAPDASSFARRYWDGAQWTDQVSPQAAKPAVQAKYTPQVGSPRARDPRIANLPPPVGAPAFIAPPHSTS